MTRDRVSPPTPEAQKKRDIGQPGGGAGRRDDVGHTSVYPASRSEGASGDAEFHGMKSWGQKDRGEEGYEDHGDSELFTPMQARLIREDEGLDEQTPVAGAEQPSGQVDDKKTVREKKK